MTLTNFIKKFVPEQFLDSMRVMGPFDRYGTKSYSQEGEDMILRRIFQGKVRGFYVDVGAHHPTRFSNTYFFYKRGWCGINIEPNPHVSDLFRSVRKRDIHVELGVSDSAGEITYYQFNEPALNTFDSESVKSSLARQQYHLKSTSRVTVERLDRILDLYLPPGTSIDFLSIDVEGLDLAVLKSNDWRRYRPKCILVEVLKSSVEDVMNNLVYGFMKQQQYVLHAKTYNTVFFLDCSSDSDDLAGSPTMSMPAL
jgi:FkbM family methyltransferase